MEEAVRFSDDFGIFEDTRHIKFVADMSANTLIRYHQNTFRYFGGYLEEIL